MDPRSAGNAPFVLPTSVDEPQLVDGGMLYEGLQRGDRGEEVSRLQSELKELARSGVYGPDASRRLDPGSADGIFGGATESAVAAFQSLFAGDLEVTGELNEATFLKLGDELARLEEPRVDREPAGPADTFDLGAGLLAAGLRLPDEEADDLGPLPEFHGGFEGLKRGDQDERIATVQDELRELAELGVYGEPMSVALDPGESDGAFGAGTEAAIRAFQSMYPGELVVDGELNEATFIKLADELDRARSLTSLSQPVRHLRGSGA